MNFIDHDLRRELRDPTDRSKLKGKRVAYRVRWDRETERGGTIGRAEHAIIWIGAACLHHDDIISMREIGHEPADRNAL